MYRIQARHRKGGYTAPPMLVFAESENEAMKRTRLYDFPDEWSIYVKEFRR